MHTEKEAKEKWCPFARAPNGESGMPINRQGDYPEHVCCVASSCMAWRWSYEEQDVGGSLERIPYYKSTPIKDSPGHFENAPVGHCGLSGGTP